MHITNKNPQHAQTIILIHARKQSPGAVNHRFPCGHKVLFTVTLMRVLLLFLFPIVYFQLIAQISDPVILDFIIGSPGQTSRYQGPPGCKIQSLIFNINGFG